MKALTANWARSVCREQLTRLFLSLLEYRLCRQSVDSFLTWSDKSSAPRQQPGQWQWLELWTVGLSATLWPVRVPCRGALLRMPKRGFFPFLNTFNNQDAAEDDQHASTRRFNEGLLNAQRNYETFLDCWTYFKVWFVGVATNQDVVAHNFELWCRTTTYSNIPARHVYFLKGEAILKPGFVSYTLA